MLHVYNCVLLKMSTWGSKHVEENIILWINNNQCIKLVINVQSKSGYVWEESIAKDLWRITRFWHLDKPYKCIFELCALCKEGKLTAVIRIARLFWSVVTCDVQRSSRWPRGCYMQNSSGKKGEWEDRCREAPKGGGLTMRPHTMYVWCQKLRHENRVMNVNVTYRFYASAFMYMQGCW